MLRGVQSSERGNKTSFYTWGILGKEGLGKERNFFREKEANLGTVFYFLRGFIWKGKVSQKKHRFILPLSLYGKKILHRKRGRSTLPERTLPSLPVPAKKDRDQTFFRTTKEKNLPGKTILLTI